ncbi:MAG: hypothetical protein WCT31_01880, partial [Candidatus Micrarchaeia archaeon]
MNRFKIAAVAVSLALAGCASSQKTQFDNRPSIQEPRAGSVLHRLDANKTYLVLISKYWDIMRISAAAGFSGHFGHIELIHNGQVFGCRPPKCAEISIDTLEKIFAGIAYEIREVSVTGNQSNAVDWFRAKVEGTPYGLYANNCTSVLMVLYTKT